MKHFPLLPLLLLTLLAGGTTASAQSVRMRDLFATMPDSLMPTLTRNNRLDCIDFIENQMEAKVRDRYEHTAELKQLTADYLLFETSEVSRVEMKLLPLPADSLPSVLVVYTVQGTAPDSHFALFDAQWRPQPLARLPLARPAVEQFFPQPSTEPADSLASALAWLRDLPLLEARLSPDAPTLTWRISLQELGREERKQCESLVQPVVVKLLP